MCANGGHQPSAAFLFMRDTRGNELFGVYTREAFENSVVRAHLPLIRLHLPLRSAIQIGLDWG
jgi:hypothetical protein